MEKEFSAKTKNIFGICIISVLYWRFMLFPYNFLLLLFYFCFIFSSSFFFHWAFCRFVNKLITLFCCCYFRWRKYFIRQWLRTNCFKLIPYMSYEMLFRLINSQTKFWIYKMNWHRFDELNRIKKVKRKYI